MDLSKYYKRYGKNKIDGAVKTLTYRHADELPKNESDTKPTLYIFRHGQSADNKEFIFSGWRTSPITQEGREQAAVLAKKLKNKKIDKLISSPQIRAIETMEIAISLNKNAENLKIETDERIKERSYGALQGTSKLEMFLEDPEKLRNYRRSYTTRAENGENLEDVCRRVVHFCDEITEKMRKENINIAVSCHGNSMRGFRKYFENLTPEKTCEIETPLGQDYAAYVIE